MRSPRVAVQFPRMSASLSAFSCLRTGCEKLSGKFYCNLYDLHSTDITRQGTALLFARPNSSPRALQIAYNPNLPRVCQVGYMYTLRYPGTRLDCFGHDRVGTRASNLTVSVAFRHTINLILQLPGYTSVLLVSTTLKLFKTRKKQKKTRCSSYLDVFGEARKRIIRGVPETLIGVRVPHKIGRVYDGADGVADGVNPTEYC